MYSDHFRSNTLITLCCDIPMYDGIRLGHTRAWDPGKKNIMLLKHLQCANSSRCQGRHLQFLRRSSTSDKAKTPSPMTYNPSLRAATMQALHTWISRITTPIITPAAARAWHFFVNFISTKDMTTAILTMQASSRCGLAGW